MITIILAKTQLIKADTHPTPEARAIGIPPLNSDSGKRLRTIPLINPSISSIKLGRGFTQIDAENYFPKHFPKINNQVCFKFCRKY